MLSRARSRFSSGRRARTATVPNASVARRHEQQLQGHALVWRSENPAWLEQGTFTRDEAITLLERHVTQLVEHYRGRINLWDVVDEAVGADGQLRPSVWLR